MEYRELKRAVATEGAKVINTYRKKYKENMENFNYTSKGKQKMINELIKEADKELMKYKQSFVESGYEIATQKRAQIQGQRAERKSLSDISFIRNAMVVDVKKTQSEAVEEKDSSKEQVSAKNSSSDKENGNEKDKGEKRDIAKTTSKGKLAVAIISVVVILSGVAALLIRNNKKERGEKKE